MPVKKQLSEVKYNKGWCVWFTDVMINEDLDMKGVVDKYPDLCPNYRTLLRWHKKYEELQEAVQEARESQVMNWRQQLDDMVNEAEKKDFANNQERLNYHAWLKSKLDVLKFKISKLAPLISDKYQAHNKANTERVLPKIVVQNYSSKK